MNECIAIHSGDYWSQSFIILWSFAKISHLPPSEILPRLSSLSGISTITTTVDSIKQASTTIW